MALWGQVLRALVLRAPALLERLVERVLPVLVAQQVPEWPDEVAAVLVPESVRRQGRLERVPTKYFCEQQGHPTWQLALVVPQGGLLVWPDEPGRMSARHAARAQRPGAEQRVLFSKHQ